MRKKELEISKEKESYQNSLRANLFKNKEIENKVNSLKDQYNILNISKLKVSVKRRLHEEEKNILRMLSGGLKFGGLGGTIKESKGDCTACDEEEREVFEFDIFKGCNISAGKREVEKGSNKGNNKRVIKKDLLKK